MHFESFQYTPACQFAGCPRPAAYKVAAAWSDGTFQELKTYALACEEHRDALLAHARRRRACLRLDDGERVDDVAVYRLNDGAGGLPSTNI